MKIQEIVSDVRSRVETAGKNYQGAFKAYMDAQRKAFGVVVNNGQTLANTEIGAAKNVFAAARASFDKARGDGMRKVANNPQAYVPNGRDQIVSAYKDTIDLLVRTGNELTDVVSTGYKSVLGRLSGKPAPKKKAAGTSRKTTAKRSGTSSASSSKSTTSTGTAKQAGSTSGSRKTAATRKSGTTKSAGSSAKASGTTKTTASSSKSGSGSTARKRTTRKTGSSASTSAGTSAANSADSGSSSA